ncbi:MAG: phenylacetate--CoA ligase family protein [Thermicanus sp.]|nr:phenylacetate--CoA ligase family protein [Thermicanus sp.]
MDIHSLAIRHFLFPLMEKVKGNRIRSYLFSLREMEELSYEDVYVLQREKLKNLLFHSISTVPAYQGYGELLASSGEDPVAILEQLPLCTKKELRSNKERYLSTTADRGSLIANKTGGSTGEAVQFYLDRKTVEYYEAARWQALSWWGIRLADKVVMILGNPAEYNVEQIKRHFRREWLLKNRYVLPGYDLKKKEVARYIRFIQEKKPVYLYGYASSLDLLAQYVVEEGIPFTHTLKGIVSTSETLYPHQRKRIEEAFSAPVINEYGAKDGGIIAYECPHGRMHLIAPNLYVEIVDPFTGKLLPEGEVGEIVVTDLNNYAMPRLRYTMGDLGSLSGEHCPCGLPYPVLGSLEGRTDDLIVCRNGEKVPGHYIAHIGGTIKGFERYQVIQESIDRFVVKIVKNDRFDPEEVNFLVRAIKEKAGEVEVRVQFVSHIPPTRSGKHRVVIRNPFEMPKP